MMYFPSVSQDSLSRAIPIPAIHLIGDFQQACDRRISQCRRIYSGSVGWDGSIAACAFAIRFAGVRQTASDSEQLLMDRSLAKPPSPG